MRIEWTELAHDRVDEIALQIAEDDRAAAIRWVEGLFEAVERLAKFPESGRMVEELEARRVRELIYGAYRFLSSRLDRAGAQHSTWKSTGAQG